MQAHGKISLIIQEGEGQTIEFKEKPTKLDREIVAFANAMGGSIFLGINDHGKIVGTQTSNRAISQIQDVARNCDSSIHVHIKKHENILEVEIREGVDKSYRCSSGFYLRTGPNSQKLTRDEIISFALGEGKIRFDEQINPKVHFNVDFSMQKYHEYLRLANLSLDFDPKDFLINLNAAEQQKGKVLLTNAAALFFTEAPQTYFPEAYITAIRYRGADRISIIDRKDMKGDLVSQVDEAIAFFKRHTGEELIVEGAPKHRALEEYPSTAIREAVINAVMHRDYFYDSSHIYMHIYRDRIELENPGGLFKGLTIENLGKRSVRRNRLIAELFFRIGFIEMIGGGITRMFNAMKDNGNPPPEIQSTNFFNITFKKRVLREVGVELSMRQKQLLHFVSSEDAVSKAQCARFLKVSGDTALRDLRVLLKHSLIEQRGSGKATRYCAKSM